MVESYTHNARLSLFRAFIWGCQDFRKRDRLTICLQTRTTVIRGGGLGKQKSLSSVRPPLLRACSDVLAHSQEKYQILVLHVDSAKKKRTAQLNVLLTEDGLRELSDGRIYCTVDKVFSFAAAFIHRNLVSAEKCEFTRMSVLYTEMVNEMLLYERGHARI